MKIVVLFTFIAGFIQGCGSITQPTASRPLVENNMVATPQLVNDSLNQHLSHSGPGTVIVVATKNKVLGRQFFAASGLTCRKVNEQNTLDSHIYCQNEQNAWFKAGNVISQYSAGTFQGAKL